MTLLSSVMPPPSCQALFERAKSLSGQTLGHLSASCPPDLMRHKGWIGQLIEQYLGAEAGSLSLPDFPHLGIELKTVPIDGFGRVRETTFVASIPLLSLTQETWTDSAVYRKLSHVLWVPIEADPHIPIPLRRIGSPFLWQPSAEDLAILKTDWEELSEKLRLGDMNLLSAKWGQYLQIRPKGANSRALCDYYDEEGLLKKTLPRAYYLRTKFTQSIFDAYYA